MISIILVNYCGKKDSIEAIKSLKNQDILLTKYKIILVDNCSVDNSYNELKNIYNDDELVDIIKSDKNGGFAYGNNFGIKYALKKYNSEYFLLINNDTVASSNILNIFYKYYEKNRTLKKIGILTGKIYYFDEKDTLWYCGGKLDKKRSGAKHLGEGEKDRKQYEKEEEVDFATGCLMFFNKILIREIGYLPEEYFMYFEDVDFSWATINNNNKIIYLPEVKIWHKIGRSSNLLEAKNSYSLFNRNRNILAKKYMRKNDYIKFKLFMYLRGVIKFGLHVIKEGVFVNTFKGL